MSGQPSPLLERLRALEPDAMTPIQALQQLDELVRQARKANEE
jgi:hypothetical protein